MTISIHPDVSIVAAIGTNRAIGHKNDLPWGKVVVWDLDWFQKLTMGQVCIVGYRTFQKMPVLKGRNVVLDLRDREPLQFLEDNHLARVPVYVIGGAKTYERWMPLARKFYLSHVPYTEKADVYMPPLPWEIKE